MILSDTSLLLPAALLAAAAGEEKRSAGDSADRPGSPNAAIGADDFFDIELFQVPGLNFQPKLSSSLIIDNVKVGEWSLTYDKTAGSMVYHVEFNRYVQFFDHSDAPEAASGKGNASQFEG